MALAKFSCPHCGKNLGKREENDYFYDSPLRVCPSCKNTYFDSRYHEIAVEGIRPVDTCANEEFLAKKRKNGRLKILGGIGVMILFVILIAVGWIFYFFPIISITMIINGVKTIKETKPEEMLKKQAELQVEARNSNERMQNPEYVQMLQSYGYARPVNNNMYMG